MILTSGGMERFRHAKQYWIGLHNSGLLHPLSTRSLLVALELYEYWKVCAEWHINFNVVLSHQRSACHHLIAIHLTPRTVRRILHEDLKFHSFKIQLVQQLLRRDLNQRSECCRKLLQMIERMPQTCKDVPYLESGSPEWYYLQKVTWKRNAFPCCLPLFS